MSTLTIDRRRLLKLGLSAGVLSCLPLGCTSVTDTESEQLLELMGDSELPLRETVTGTLSQEDFATLSTLCSYVDRAWALDADLPAYLKQLQADIALKTGRTPSYLTEYRNAIELIRLTVGNSDTIDQAWTTLLFAHSDNEDGDRESGSFAATRLGRARRLVFSEIITHQIPISGGFKSLGLVNYRGYFGGPYTAPGSYRRGTV